MKTGKQSVATSTELSLTDFCTKLVGQLRDERTARFPQLREGDLRRSLEGINGLALFLNSLFETQDQQFASALAGPLKALVDSAEFELRCLETFESRLYDVTAVLRANDPQLALEGLEKKNAEAEA